MNNSIYVEIKSLFEDYLFDIENITPATDLRHDLGFDSLETTFFMMRVETAFCITLRPNDFKNNCRTVGDVESLVRKYLRSNFHQEVNTTILNSY